MFPLLLDNAKKIYQKNHYVLYMSNIQDIIELNSKNIRCILKNKKFVNVFCPLETIKIKLENVFIPFGVEKFNNKYILNLEFEIKSNIHNNYISTLSNLESKIINKKYETEVNIESCLVNKKFLTSLKTSILGHILRAHISDSTEVYILKKDSTHMSIDKDNLKGTNVNIELTLKGIWINDDTYGFYWNTNKIQIIKFN
jgi:hypothetical protein